MNREQRKTRQKALKDNDLIDFCKPTIRVMACTIYDQVFRVGETFYRPLADAAQSYLSYKIKSLVDLLEGAKRKTATVEDVKFIAGKKVYLPETFSNFRCKKFVYNGDCYFLAKSSFARLVRRLADDYTYNDNDHIRFSKEALEALQVITERHMLELIDMSIIAAVKGDRKTLFDKDIELVLEIRRGCDY